VVIRLSCVRFIGAFGVLLGLLLVSCTGSRDAETAIKVGLIAPLSGYRAPSGKAIQRGMLLAIDEVNREGGVLGRPLALVVDDVENDPLAGVAALQELVQRERIVAVFTGTFSTVILAQLDSIHARQIPLISPLGLVTTITQKGRVPNYAFRTTMSDEYANEFMVRYTLDVVDARRPGLIADTTAWGNSNVDGVSHWLDRLARPAASIERFSQGETNMRHQLARLRAAGADALSTFGDIGGTQHQETDVQCC
jgi:branched-chain amino acid transport system substrate-binding protein